MKSIFKIITIMLIQAMFVSCAGAQEAVFCAEDNTQKSTLAPRLFIGINKYQNAFQEMQDLSQTIVFEGRSGLQQVIADCQNKKQEQKAAALKYLIQLINSATVQDSIFAYPYSQKEAVGILKSFRTKFTLYPAYPSRAAEKDRKTDNISISLKVLEKALRDRADKKTYGRKKIPVDKIMQAVLLSGAFNIHPEDNGEILPEIAQAVAEFFEDIEIDQTAEQEWDYRFKIDRGLARSFLTEVNELGFDDDEIEEALSKIHFNIFADYAFNIVSTEEDNQLNLIIQDFKAVIAEKERLGEEKEVVIYEIGLGREPTEAIQLIKAFDRAIRETVVEEERGKWRLRLIAIDTNEYPLRNAKPIFDALNNGAYRKEFRDPYEEGEYKKYFDRSLSMNIWTRIIRANALDAAKLKQIGKGRKGDYIFHRHITYLNAFLANADIDMKEIKIEDLPRILNTYLSTRNIIGALCKENTRYITEPTDIVILAKGKGEDELPVLRIPGAKLLTFNHFFPQRPIWEQRLRNRGTGIYLVKDPGKIIKAGLRGFCEAIAKQQDFEGRRIRREDVTRELERNGWNVLQAAAVFGTNRKRIRALVGVQTIKQGRLKLREREKEMIICALEAYGWNVKEAANALEIYPSRIYKMLTLNFIRTGRKKAALILREKVKAVLKGHNWNVLETSRDPLLLELRLGPSEINTILSRGWIARQRKQYNDEQAEKEKREIIKAIKMFLKHNDCLIKVAQYLGIARATLNDKLARYSISFTDMKFDEDRVVPVLKLTKGNVSRAGQRLGIDAGVLMERFGIQIEKIKKEHEENIRKQRTVLVADAIEAQRGDKARTAAEIGIAEKTLHEWMDKYYLFEISPATLHAYRLEVKLMVIDNIFSNIKQKAFSLDRSNENAVRMFHRTSDFHLFRAAEIMKGLDAYIEKVYPAFELAAKINACGRTIKSLQTFIVNHQPGKSADYLFLIDRLEDIIETVDFYEWDMEKLGFTSFSAKPDARTARLSNEELINDIRKAMPSSKSKNPDWRQFNILIEELKLRDGVDVIVEKDEINQAWFSPRAYIRNLSMGEDNFIRYAAENIAQHVEHGTALVIRQKFKDYTQITVMDNGDGFVNRYNNGKVKVEDAIIYKRSFGSKKGYAGVFQNHGQALTLVVSYPDISIIKQPGESAIILPATNENSRIPIIEPQVVSGAENAKKIGTEITGYFYNQPNEFVRKRDWRSYLAQKLRSKLSAEMPALKNKKAKVNKFNLLVEQAI
ncbi:MAG: helix-turn-helix domain-containing protein [Candidatus Omnitrophica bacterium]|nr:helix-turn-helix domain-containing protein [Candidatus Omnitrophota bacterium]